MSRAARLALLGLAGLWAPGSARAQESTPPAPAAAPRPLSAEDRALLRDLDLLMELELLRDWDPEADLPIPADPVQANAVLPKESP